ncbi:hydrolase Nlp/P60 [bacterium]|nr:hydrolase Nlp/P60 [bacterium]
MIRCTAWPALLLAAVLLVGCSPKRVLRTDPGPGREPGVRPPAEQPVPPPPRDEVGLGRQVAGLVRQQLGLPYRWGGSSPDRGFDCSGLVQWAYGEVGVPLPRVVRDQSRAGRRVDRGSLVPGDLLFFAMGGSGVSHVGVYVGDGDFVHAPSSGRPVRTDSLRDPFWRARWRDARRLTEN